MQRSNCWPGYGTGSPDGSPSGRSRPLPRRCCHARSPPFVLNTPNVRVSIVEAASPTLLRRVRAGRLDVAVVAVDPGPVQSEGDDLNRYELPRIGLYVAVPDSHRLARRGRVRPAELADDCWIVGQGADGDPQFAAWPTLTDARIGYSARHWPTRLGLVAAGLGISVVPGAATPSIPAGVTVLAGRRPGSHRSHRADRHVCGRERPSSVVRDRPAEASSRHRRSTELRTESARQPQRSVRAPHAHGAAQADMKKDPSVITLEPLISTASTSSGGRI